MIKTQCNKDKIKPALPMSIYSMINTTNPKYILFLLQSKKDLLIYDIDINEFHIFKWPNRIFSANICQNQLYVFFKDKMEIYDIILTNMLNDIFSKIWKLKKIKTFIKDGIIYAFPLTKINFIYFQSDVYFKLEYDNNNNNINSYKKYYINNQYLIIIETNRFVIYENYKGLIYESNDSQITFLNIWNYKIYKLYNKYNNEGSRIIGHDLNLYLDIINEIETFNCTSFVNCEDNILLHSSINNLLWIMDKGLQQIKTVLKTTRYYYYNNTVYYLYNNQFYIFKIPNIFDQPFKIINTSIIYEELEGEFDISDNEYRDIEKIS